MKNLEKELLEQIRLMNYDRSKILSEQKPDNLMPYQSDYGLSPNYTPAELAANAQKQAERLKEIDPHMMLPLLSVMTIWLPPLSAAFELADAALYLAEGKYYEAGLAAAFALIPGGAFGTLARGFSKAEKEVLGELLERQAKGETVEFTAKQQKLLKELSKKETQNQIKRRLAIQGLKQLFKEAMSISVLHRIIYKLVTIGYLPVKFLTTMGLTIGTVFYTWDAIGKSLGLCNPASLKMLLLSDKEWVKKIGEIGQYLQPFTTPCEQEAILKELLKKGQEPGLTKEMVLNRLKFIEEQQNTLILSDENYSNIESQETLSVQIALRALGYTKFTEVKTKITKVPYYVPNFENNNIDIKANSGAGKYNDYDPSGGIGRARAQTTGLASTGSIKSDQAATMKLLYRDEPIEERKDVNVNFKWGYYDYNTDMVVREFQKKNGLSVDGSVGVNTAKKLWEKVNGLSSVSDYGTKIQTWTDKDREKLKQELIKKVKELENQKTPPVDLLNQKATEEQIKKLTKEVEQNATDNIENMNPEDWAEELGIK